jgi:hypothetical protein
MMLSGHTQTFTLADKGDCSQSEQIYLLLIAPARILSLSRMGLTKASHCQRERQRSSLNQVLLGSFAFLMYILIVDSKPLTQSGWGLSPRADRISGATLNVAVDGVYSLSIINC